MMRVIIIVALWATLLSACSVTEPATTPEMTITAGTTVEAPAEPQETAAVQAGEIPSPTSIDDPSGATITVYDFGSMVLHAFVNPPAGFGTAAFIVEGDTSLVLIDSHFSASAAGAFREYASSLGKPLDRIVVTHEHPDHVNGLRSAFTDVVSYASPEVARIVGSAIDEVVNNGREEIDGIAYEFEIYHGAESAESLVIKLPEYGVMATGDLLYNDYHMVMNRDLTPWIELLMSLQADEGYGLILPGHGAPDGTQLYKNNLDYLQRAWQLYGELDDQNTFESAMTDSYPDHEVVRFLQLGAGRMYPK